MSYAITRKVLTEWVAPMTAWAAIVLMLVASLAVLLGPAE